MKTQPLKGCVLTAIQETMMHSMQRTLALSLLVVGALGATGVAHARDVYWSVGVGSPGVSVGVGSVPPVYMAPQPVYVAPPPVMVRPQPVYMPPPVYYAPPVIHRPAPVYYYDGYGDRPRGHRHKRPRHRDWR